MIVSFGHTDDSFVVTTLWKFDVKRHTKFDLDIFIFLSLNLNFREESCQVLMEINHSSRTEGFQ